MKLKWSRIQKQSSLIQNLCMNFKKCSRIQITFTNSKNGQVVIKKFMFSELFCEFNKYSNLKFYSCLLEIFEFSKKLFEISKNVHVSKNIREIILIFYDSFEKIKKCFKTDSALCF